MKKTQHLLILLFCIFMTLTALLYVAGEFFNCDMMVFADASRQTRFIVCTTMILLTIGLLPLSLRLFKLRRVQDDLLSRKAPALMKWGCLRLCTMGLLLVADTFLYYAFGLEPAYGYLAVVVLLCMPFVVPTMGRCEAEVQPVESNPEAPTTESDDEKTNGSHSQL